MSLALDYISEFKIIPAVSGEPTAVHVPSGMLIHSCIDPRQEAAKIAESFRLADASHVILIGGGLGYLAEALRVSDDSRMVTVIESQPELIELSGRTRPAAAYGDDHHIKLIRCSTVSSLHRALTESNGTSEVLVDPYFERLSLRIGHPMSGFIQQLRTSRASNAVYCDLIARNIRNNAQLFDELLPLSNVDARFDDPVIVVGAGPGLDICIDVLRAFRDRLVLVAASGAVPTLSAAGICPEWIIALEAKEVVVRDLLTLRGQANVVVFPWTNRGVFELTEHRRYAANANSSCELAASGGTSILPAVDFALTRANYATYLVGVDLSNRAGAYANSANRASLLESETFFPPKFAAMRNAIEALISRRRNEGYIHEVLHVSSAADALSRTTQLQLDKFALSLSSHINASRRHV